MNVLITGSSCGIGRATALKFLDEGHTVFGIDILPPIAPLSNRSNYKHYLCDVSSSNLPDLPAIDILINNAGVQDDETAIDVNLKGLIAVTEKYGLQKNIKSILMNASVSAHNGSEFPRYAASKGGVLAYTKYVAREVAKYGATCNSLSLGGVTTALNNPIINDEKLYKAVLDETLLKKWTSAEECAEWIYFLTVVNKSMTAQDVLVDNGEIMNQKFIWPE